MKTYFQNLNKIKILVFVKLLLLMPILCHSQANFRVLFSDQDLALQSLEYSRTSAIGTPCGQGERITTSNIQGKKISEVDWYNGYRCGMTKVYQNGILVKEIKFYYNYILSYTSYENGVVKCHISEDRNSFKRNGQIVQDKWQNITVVIGNKKAVVLSKMEFVDLTSMMLMPEEIVDFLEGINNAAGDAIQNGNKNLFVCGGNVKALPGADIKTALNSSNQQTKTTAFENIHSNVNQCSANLSSANRSNYNGGGSGPSAEQARITAATSAIDNMIAKCEAMKDDNSLIADPEDDVWYAVRPLAGSSSLPVLRAAASGRAAELTQIVIRTGNIAYNAASATTIGGSAAGGGAAGAGTLSAGYVAVVGLAAVGAFTLGFGAGTLLNMATESVGINDAVINTFFNAKEKVDEGIDAINSSVNSAIGFNPPPQNNTGAKLVLPGGGQDCQKFKDLKERCDNNGWQTMECKDFVRIFSGCGSNVDPREVYTNPDGDFAGGSCANISAADQQKNRCKGMGMFAMIPPGGELVCSMNKAMDFNLLTYNPKAKWWTDPSPNDGNTFLRTDFKKIFSNSKIQAYNRMTNGQFKQLSDGTAKSTLFVFLDADCPACKSFSAILNSKEVSDAMAKNIDIVAIDAGANLDLCSDLNILGYPSFFLKKSNGTKTPMVIGAFSKSDLIKFMQTP